VIAGSKWGYRYTGGWRLDASQQEVKEHSLAMFTAPLTALAAARGVTEDAIALAAALANPWATVVLSGAVTRAHLGANLAALTAGDLPELNLAEPPAAYWAARAARPWR
jgi:aryl-alcohol dehydrogenase-like predicted oxidoreductase